MQTISIQYTANYNHVIRRLHFYDSDHLPWSYLQSDGKRRKSDDIPLRGRRNYMIEVEWKCIHSGGNWRRRWISQTIIRGERPALRRIPQIHLFRISSYYFVFPHYTLNPLLPYVNYILWRRFAWIHVVPRGKKTQHSRRLNSPFSFRPPMSPFAPLIAKSISLLIIGYLMGILNILWNYYNLNTIPWLLSVSATLSNSLVL